ncbi:MAG TPA: cupin fold metalloprotein, WbuC family [Solibacterales bacterium]|nr:cupin fold metalloprotein, WbuC family [Bryobacterales bacterium]
MNGVQLISAALLESVERAAEDSPRRRMNHNFHAGPDDNPHRFLNVMRAGTYVCPHRHAEPAKAETFVVLRGHAAVALFDEEGHVRERHLLGLDPRPADFPDWAKNAPAAVGIDLAPGLWHTITALSESAICFEVKPGPWSPASDKEFAPWAPREGDPAAAAYLAGWLR